MDKDLKGKQKPKAHRTPLGKKKIVSIVLLPLVVAVVVLAALFLVDKFADSGDRTSSGVVCDEQVIKAASNAIKDYDLTTQNDIVPGIIETDGYETDINCSYIVARYALAIGDVDMAEGAISIIKTLRDDNQFSEAFEIDILSVEEMEQNVRSLKINIEEMEQFDYQDDLGEIDRMANEEGGE